jgi:hypothetical protein
MHLQIWSKLTKDKKKNVALEVNRPRVEKALQ